MDTLRDLGVDVPGQVAVTGFDGIVAGRLSSPQLTTVRQPMAAMGAEAVKILVDRIERPQERTAFAMLPGAARGPPKLRMPSRLTHAPADGSQPGRVELTSYR